MRLLDYAPNWSLMEFGVNFFESSFSAVLMIFHEDGGEVLERLVSMPTNPDGITFRIKSSDVFQGKGNFSLLSISGGTQAFQAVDSFRAAFLRGDIGELILSNIIVSPITN